MEDTPLKKRCFDCKTANSRRRAIEYANKGRKPKKRIGLKEIMALAVKKLKLAEERAARVAVREGIEKRNRWIMELRFEHNKTLEEIGKEVGVTRERVRQIICMLTPDGGSGTDHSPKEFKCKGCGSVTLYSPRSSAKSKLYCSDKCREENAAKRRLEALKHCRECGSTSNLVPRRSQNGVAYAAVCTSCNTERSRKYRHSSEEKKNIIRAIAKRSTEKNRAKYNIASRFNYFRREYKIIPPSKCTACGEEKKLIAHHVDYSKELLVCWVCPLCHHRIHRDNLVVPKEYLSDYSYLRKRTLPPRSRPKESNGV